MRFILQGLGFLLCVLASSSGFAQFSEGNHWYIGNNNNAIGSIPRISATRGDLEDVAIISGAITGSAQLNSEYTSI